MVRVQQKARGRPQVRAGRPASLRDGFTAYSALLCLRRQISDPAVMDISQRVLTFVAITFDAASKMLEAARTLDPATLDEVAERIGADQIYIILKERRGVEMRSIIDAGLGCRRIGNATLSMKKLTKSTIDALKRIRDESKLNELRVRKYNLSAYENEQVAEVNTERLKL
jgi:hypothetical protein